MTTGRIGPAGPTITSQDAAPGKADWASAGARNPALQGLDPNGPELANNILTMIFGQQQPGAAPGAAPKAQPGAQAVLGGAGGQGLLGTGLNVPELVNTVLTMVLGKQQPTPVPGTASPASPGGFAGPGGAASPGLPPSAGQAAAADRGDAPAPAGLGNLVLQGLDPNGPALANTILTLVFGNQQPGPAPGTAPMAQAAGPSGPNGAALPVVTTTMGQTAAARSGIAAAPAGAANLVLQGLDPNGPALANTILTMVFGNQPGPAPGTAPVVQAAGRPGVDGGVLPGAPIGAGQTAAARPSVATAPAGATNPVLQGLDPNGPALANNILTMAFGGQQPGPTGATERNNAMATGPIGAAGPGAAPQFTPPGREDWASTHGAAQSGQAGNSAAAPGHNKPGPAPIQSLLGTGTDLATNILNLVFGAQPAQALGMPPQSYSALAAAKPWHVASLLLGAPGTLDAAAFAKLEAMPGPLAELLRAGAEPRAALAVQEHWIALNAKVEDQTGLSMLPTVQPSVWANSAGDARAILGTTPRAMPPEAMDRVIAALGGPRATPLTNDAAGRNLAVMALGAAPAAADVRPSAVPASTTAVVAVPDRTPVAISREIADRIALPAPMPLGAGLTMQHDPASGAVIVGFEAAGAGQVLGPLAPQVAAALAPALAEALAGMQGAPRGIDISVSMTLGADGMPASLTVSGSLVLADGTVKPFGTAPTLAAPQGGPTATPQEMPATAVLHLSGGADAGADSLAGLLGPYIEYMRPTPVPLDLAAGPGAEALPDDTRLWRMDDTRIFVALGTAGATEAMLEAARLHRAAIAGNLTLEDMPPGSGFETWDGSLLSLSLAGIRKTSVAAAEETPPRVRALHLDNDSWRASRGPREVSATTAGEDLRLFLAYGLDPAHAAGKGPQGGLAEQARTGFADALLQMERVRLAWWLPPGEAARRQEAWASVAREWATTLAGLDAAGPPVLPPGVPPVEALLAIAAHQGSAAAWSAFQASGLDLGDLLDAAGADRAALSEALTGGALLAAGRLGVPADRATATGTEPADLALAAAREAFLHAVVETERGTLPREALEAALDAYGQAALAHLTEGAPLAHGDQGALAARLGHAAQTDVERGYLAPYLRVGRMNDTAPEDGDQTQRRTG